MVPVWDRSQNCKKDAYKHGFTIISRGCRRNQKEELLRDHVVQVGWSSDLNKTEETGLGKEGHSQV